MRAGEDRQETGVYELLRVRDREWLARQLADLAAADPELAVRLADAARDGGDDVDAAADVASLLAEVEDELTGLGAEAAEEPEYGEWYKVRPKAQLTLPEEIRRALHIGEGDEVEFAVHEDGTVTIRGYVSIPTDQAWFFTPEWLAGEREADEEIAAGRGTAHESADDMFAHLDTLGPTDG